MSEVNQILDAIGRGDAHASEQLKLHFFAGLSIEGTASAEGAEPGVMEGAQPNKPMSEALSATDFRKARQRQDLTVIPAEGSLAP